MALLKEKGPGGQISRRGKCSGCVESIGFKRNGRNGGVAHVETAAAEQAADADMNIKADRSVEG